MPTTLKKKKICEESHISPTCILFADVDFIYVPFVFRCTLCNACSKAARTLTPGLIFLSKNDYAVHVPNSTCIFTLVCGFTYIANIN